MVSDKFHYFIRITTYNASFHLRPDKLILEYKVGYARQSRQDQGDDCDDDDPFLLSSPFICIGQGVSEGSQADNGKDGQGRPQCKAIVVHDDEMIFRFKYLYNFFVRSR
jgi:hypothetical protein